MTVPPLDTDRARLTSRYGYRMLDGKQDLHTGIDLAAAVGTQVYAVRGGTVIVSDPPGVMSGYGNVVVLRHDSNVSQPVYSLYAHMSGRDVAAGDRVVEGQVIGEVGDTGGARGEIDHHIGAAHLHFELLTAWPPRGKDMDRIDPTRLWPPALTGGAVKKTTPKPLQPSAATSGGGGVFGGLLTLAAFGWAVREYQKKRRLRS